MQRCAQGRDGEEWHVGEPNFSSLRSPGCRHVCICDKARLVAFISGPSLSISYSSLYHWRRSQHASVDDTGKCYHGTLAHAACARLGSSAYDTLRDCSALTGFHVSDGTTRLRRGSVLYHQLNDIFPCLFPSPMYLPLVDRIVQSFKIFEAAPTDVRGVPHKTPAPAEYFL